jgi:hypothetical protein
MSARHSGAALVVGLILLSLVSLLGMAAASAARIELRLAHNERFRENAASAASAGIEFALSHMIAIATDSGFVLSSPADLSTTSRFEIRARFLGREQGLPQLPGSSLAASHFEIESTGHSARGAVDIQRARIMQVVTATGPVVATDCEPLAPGVRCFTDGEWLRLSWQRVPPP